MSAPILTCALADAIGPLLIEMNRSLGVSVSLDWLPDIGKFVVYVHDGNRAFQGFGTKPSDAVMEANSHRQDFNEQTEIAA